MRVPRVLTFNWHDPYLHMFAQTGFDVLVGDWMRRADGTTGWDFQKRPLPGNLTLLKEQSEAIQAIQAGRCDLVLCHTLQDLAFVAPFKVPVVFITHNSLQNDAMNDRATMDKLRHEIGSFLQARHGVFAAISPMKYKSWGIEGSIVLPGINLDDYGGFTGADACALSVGNLFVERDHMLGFSFLKEILREVPHVLVGENPQVREAQKAADWESLKNYFRRCRVYVNATVEAFEDGYNLGMLEAMASGMPVVSLANATSPIIDGENGFISSDTAYLRACVLALLEDPERATEIGSRARKTVASQFSVNAFVENWRKIADLAFDRFHSKMRVQVGPNPSVDSVRLETPKEELFPYEWQDVAVFLAADLEDITVAKLKLDLVGSGYLCDVFLGNKTTRQTMAWQGLEVVNRERLQIAWPPYLGNLDLAVKGIIEGAISASIDQVEKGQLGDAQSIHVNLGGGEAFEFRVGEDRVTPGDARSDIYLHHAKRYTFARQFCRGKAVLDLGSGAGYGAKILKRDAARVVGLDLDRPAQQFGNRVFADPGIRRIVGDIRSVGLKAHLFDVAVCFEAMEHVREHDALLGEIRRLLRPDGTLVISTPNKQIYGQPANANAYHVVMLDLDEFEQLLDRFYEEVRVYGQMRAMPNQPFYEAFDFRGEAGVEDEVFVAVCKGPRAEILYTAQSRGPAVWTKAKGRAQKRDGKQLKVLISHVSNPIAMGRYYVDAFRRTHDVITCGPAIDAEELKQWRTAEEQHAFKSIESAQSEKLDLIGRLAEPCDIPMARGKVDMSEVLDQLPKGWHPDVMIWVDSATGFLPVGLEKLDCPTACIMVDTHTGQIDWRLEYARQFSHTFLAQNQYIEQFKRAGCSFVEWLPCACAPEIHGKIPAEKAYDIGFVGQTHRQWHPHRVRLLERLFKAKFDVHVESKILQEMALFNSRSRIVFNRSLNADLNMRVFESLCSGSFLMTDKLPDEAMLNTLFSDREHLVLYDENDLEPLVRYYLDHDTDREEIAGAGRKAVLEKHTYAHRADQVIAGVISQTGIARCVAGQPAVDKPGSAAKLVTPLSKASPQGKRVGDPDAGLKFKKLFAAQRGPVRLNLGCGEDHRPGYINVDAYVPTADLQMDIFDLQMDDGVVDEIYSSHMLEHLGKAQVPQVLSEWRRVLKPGGTLRLNLPDLQWCMQQWLRTSEEHRWGWALDTIYGLQTHAGEYHKTGFTADRAERIVEAAGFSEVQVSWTWSHGMRCLWIEARRPESSSYPGVARCLPIERFETQFPVEMSEMVPYSLVDVAGFPWAHWQVAFVSFEKLPMDSADLTLTVAVISGNKQLVLQGIRVFRLDQTPFVIYPGYLQNLSPEIQQKLGKTIGDALAKKVNDPRFKAGAFSVVPFEGHADWTPRMDGDYAVPGNGVFSQYMAQYKRYLLAERFAAGAEIFDDGCGTGFGAKRLSRVAKHIDAVDRDSAAISYAGQTYGDSKIDWSQGELRTMEVRPDRYDVMTSFGILARLSSSESSAYLKKLHQSLKPGGVALIAVPNTFGAIPSNAPGGRFDRSPDVFQDELARIFEEVIILGQSRWSDRVEVSGQCIVSGRVTDDDEAYVAVCTKRSVSEKVESGSEPQVSIVMPLYNKASFTKACLKALGDNRDQVAYEVILVDNGSSDATAELLDGLQAKPGFRVVRNGENLGFSRANNLGAKYAQAPHILFLNNDTVPHSGWLDTMVAQMEADDAMGIVGAKLLYPDTGKIQHAGLAMINGTPDHVHRHADADAPEVNVARDLDMVTGACMLIRKALFDRLGGFDEAYVNGVEDVDLCLKVRDLGYRVRYIPTAVVDHYEGTSDGRYTHVRPNLERFSRRWGGRFSTDGRFSPLRSGVSKSRANPVREGRAHASRGEALRGVWEGTQFVYHSLSIVNMALTSELIKAGCELKLVPYEKATFGPEKDPIRYVPIAARIHAELTGEAQFHVRHQWPPQFEPPPKGHWIMIQPWEFGQLPENWVKPMRESVDEIWVPSHFVKRCYTESGIDPERVQVIPNGVNTDLMHPEAAKLLLATDKKFKFLFVGGTIFRKGVDVLLKTYYQTFSSRDDVCLVIKGMGEDSFYKGQTAGDQIRQIQADPEAPEILYLTEELSEEDMAGLYTACDCLVHPYRGEGFGMPVAEAMGCGLPVIVTQGGACDDFCNLANAFFVTSKKRSIRMDG
jgi:GT2 family glycosyltransferase/2-polyprenyl-3-methyl-5-hydroxy-6-metoxy-1,4-benzoquinol methylase/spore maturation protein CgeB